MRSPFTLALWVAASAALLVRPASLLAHGSVTPRALSRAHGAPMPTADSTRGLLYRAVRPGRDTLLVVGSVHLLDAATAALPDRLLAAVRSARAVVFELDLDSATAQMPQAVQLGRQPAHQTLWTSLTPRTDTLVRGLLPRLGLQPAQVAAFKPWLLGLQLAGVAAQASGLAPGVGVDRQAFALARQAGRRVVALETAAEQLAIFDGMSPPDQDAFLANAVLQFDSVGTQTRALLAAWRRGDADALDGLANGRLARYPAVKRALVDDRNRRWVPTLDAIARPDAGAGTGHVTVVVGAAHLTGPAGLASLLRAAGYRVDAL